MKESDFEELKQDLQMVRYEMLNDIKKNEEETLKYISLLHAGIGIIGDEVLKDVNDLEISTKFKEFKQFESELRDSIEQPDLDTTAVDKLNQSHSWLDDSTNDLLKGSLPNMHINGGISNLQVLKSVSAENLTDNNITAINENTSDSAINEKNLVVSEMNTAISLTELHVINEEDEVLSSVYEPEKS